MSFNLNTNSGYLHKEGHGGGENVESFTRADAADLYAFKHDLDLKLCSVCFSGTGDGDEDRPEAQEKSAEAAPGYEGDADTDLDLDDDED